MQVLPQSQYAAKVSDKRKYDFDKDDEIVSAIRALESKYEGRGRVLVRASGTEPLVRVMIEGEDQYEMDADVYRLSVMIENKLQ
jgi:phosphoglucosamine mutase